MADIAKCLNHQAVNCQLKSRCYRFLATDATLPPKEFDYYANSCNGYWEIETESERIARLREEEKEQYKLQ